MSDFGDRIKDARISTRPLVGLAAVQAADQPPPEEVDVEPEVSADELAAHRRRVDELARRVDALNAALLRDVPRTATVRAQTDTELLALERDVFLAAVTGHAASAMEADGVIAARLESTPGLL